MTSRTRRRLTVCLVLGLIALPAEALLFPIARTPDPTLAALEWADAQPLENLRTASRHIDRYPAAYRRAIMSELTPADRSTAWRHHFEQYLESRPNLSSEQVAVVREAIELASPDAFSPLVAADHRERIGQLYTKAIDVLGKQDAGELFVTMGPRVLAKGNALPLRERIANSIRGWRVASAEYPDCNCNIEIDTCDLVPDPWLQCSENYTCIFDLDWPMCGPLWSWACTGWCRILKWPSAE
jgi:hypothetical protein